MASNKPAIQVDVYRGSKIESSHQVDAVVLDNRGEEVDSFGNSDTEVFTRSVIKPLQALPLILSNAYLIAPDPMKAMAIACASHEAQPIHIAVVAAWLKQLGLVEDDLVCGPQRPAGGGSPAKIHNNCSGKHGAMLATCLHRGWDIKSYYKWDHPLQKEIRAQITRLSDFDMESADWGIDGCGLPTYRMPLRFIARAMTHYLQPTALPSSDLRRALETEREAWSKEPWMISGHGSLDSEALAATQSQIFTKIGAEGNYIGVLYNQGRVFALKARDGATRASRAALYLLLERYANLDPAILGKIATFALPAIKNVAGEPVGFIRASF